MSAARGTWLVVRADKPQADRQSPVESRSVMSRGRALNVAVARGRVQGTSPNANEVPCLVSTNLGSLPDSLTLGRPVNGHAPDIPDNRYGG